MATKETPNGDTPNGETRDGEPRPAYGKGSGFQGKKGRSGPPIGNRNNMRHGLKAGKLPVDCAHIEHQLNALRRQLEDKVMEARGEVTMLDAANIQTAIRWERHSALALRWLRVAADKLKPTDQLTFSREIAKASTERDKALAVLGLDRDASEDLFAKLYAKPVLLMPAPDDAAANLEDK
jgi:hypothetical protein